MITEVIWISGAAEDFQNIQSESEQFAVFARALAAALELLKALPERGAKIPHSRLIRRILVGKKRQYGLYYSPVGTRLIVIGLFNLRQAPEEIAKVLSRRGIIE